jgi:DNA modification methylase
MSRIIEKLEWGKYVSPVTDKGVPPFNWYAFKHRFGSALVSKIFEMFGLSKGETVFDPFLGGATTFIKAKFEGYNAVGLDILPLSVFLADTLTNTYNPAQLKKTLSRISDKIDHNVMIPDVDILKKAFSDSTLKYIYSLKKTIGTLDTSEKNFFLLGLLSILDKASKAKKAGGFLRITDQRKAPISTVKKMFFNTCNRFIEDLNLFQFSNTKTTAILGDARNYPNDVKKMQYDAILTSPPYPNRHDYTRIYQLELLVGFLNSNRAVKDLRYNTLRSHVEAKKNFEIDYPRPKTLEKKMDELKTRNLNNNQIITTLYGYFEDMYLCLREMSSVLKTGKFVGLVVSNVRFAGVMIPVDELLGEIGEQLGLQLQGIYVLRYRGNSPQQMSKHSKELSRESLVVWKK